MPVKTSNKCILHLLKIKQENPDITTHQMYDELEKWLEENPAYKFRYTMSFCQYLDKILFNVWGSYRTTAYNFPKDGDEIIINNQIYYAYNVGIFTFDLT